MSLSAKEIIALINAQVDPLNELVRRSILPKLNTLDPLNELVRTSILPKLNTLEEQISRLTEKQSVTMTDTGGGVKNQENIKRENLKNPENIAKKLKVIIEDNLANISIVCFHKI